MYILCVPDPVPDGPMPVVLGFHGGGGRADGWMRRTRWHEHGSEHGFVTLYMQGCRDGVDDCSEPGGRYAWNIGKPGKPSLVDDTGYTRQVVRRLEEVHGLAIDHTRVYGTGHSLGGIFIYSVACDLPDLFAAIGPISAPPSDGSCRLGSGGPSIFHIHGTADPNVPFDTGCCSAAQKNPDHPGYLAECEELPGCRNPVNWWPPVRSGRHPAAKVVGLNDFAQVVLGCSGEWRTTFEDDAATCSSYVGCERGEVEVCLLEGIGHRLPDIDREFDLRDYLWSRFQADARQAQE
jgi:polyhydroxybutyrate depolymerase